MEFAGSRVLLALESSQHIITVLVVRSSNSQFSEIVGTGIQQNISTLLNFGPVQYASVSYKLGSKIIEEN